MPCGMCAIVEVHKCVPVSYMCWLVLSVLFFFLVFFASTCLHVGVTGCNFVASWLANDLPVTVRDNQSHCNRLDKQHVVCMFAPV